MAQAHEIIVRCPNCGDTVELSFDNDGFSAYNVDLAPHNPECDAKYGLCLDHPVLVELAVEHMSEYYHWSKTGRD